ncbi:MAG: type II toxin-antitoxin system HicA family toxin [Patescibacteria group bacterium]
MPKLPNYKPKELVRLLKKNGFIEKRQTGSHLQMLNLEKRLLVTVPIHNKELKRKTLYSILKSAQIKY